MANRFLYWIFLFLLFHFGRMETMAHSVTIDGIVYNINPERGDAWVLRTDGDIPADVTIKASVEYEDFFHRYDGEYPVTAIYHWAFQYKDITSVAIPNSVVAIGESAFYDCKNLKTVRGGYGVKELYGHAFQRCTSLESIEFSSSLDSIGPYAFEECSNLYEVSLGGYVRYIDDYAFANCTSLHEITIPSTIEKMGRWAFKDCTNLYNVTINNKTVSEHEFMGCTSLQLLTFGNNVETIEIGGFYGCTDLAFLEIPDNVKAIGSDAFMNCTGLTIVIIGNGVTRIYSDAFRNCTSLKEVSIGNNVEYIDMLAFYQCSRLSEITIPSSVKEIGGSAFGECTGLVSAIIDARSIGTSFKYCSNLQFVVFGEHTEEISIGAFDYCEKIIQIACTATVPPVCGRGAFWYVDKQKCKLYVPSSSLELYKKADEWKEFFNISNLDTKIESLSDASITNDIKSCYELNGRLNNRIVHGLNIIRTDDGIMKKILVK